MNARVLRMSETLATIIAKRLSDKRLVLPAMPSIAVRCSALLNKPDYDVRKLVAELEMDAPLAGRIISLASSSMYGPGVVNSLPAAVSRLGAARLKEIIIEWSAEELFKSPDRQVMTYLRTLWLHSVAVGVVARDLVTLCSEADLIDAAYLCGLLHDIGKPVVATMLLSVEDELRSDPGGRWSFSHRDWLDIVSSTHRRVGTEVAREWGLPDSVVSIINDSTEYDATDRRSLSNFVRLANAIVKLEGVSAEEIDRKDCEALIMIGRSMLGVDAALLERVRSQLQTKLQEAKERI